MEQNKILFKNFWKRFIFKSKHPIILKVKPNRMSPNQFIQDTVRLKKPKRIVSNAPTQENATLERPKRSSSSQISEESVNPVERKRSSLNETNGESVCLVETSDKLYKIPVSFQSNQEVYVHGKIPSKINSDDPSALLGWLLSNTTRLQLVFLGTSSWSPTNERNLPSIAIRTNSDVWIFDAGASLAKTISFDLFFR